MIRNTKIPHSVRIILTDRCNLNCTFCLMDAGQKRVQDELKTEDWFRFFARLKALQVFNVSLSGGEILLRDDLLLLLQKLRDNRMHKISLLTNGTLINDDIASQLYQLNIKSIAISLDGLEESHDQIRGKGAFVKTMAGIQRLIGAGIIPEITFTPTKSNYRDLGPLLDFVAPLGVKIFHVNTLTPEGRCLHIYKEIMMDFPRQIKEVLDVIEEKKKMYSQIKINCSLGFYYYLPESYTYFKENPQNYQMKHLKDGCGAASTSCVIMPNGDMVPCEGFSNFVGGNIREKDLLEIWGQAECFKTIRDLSLISMDQSPFCKECRYLYICDGGCRATAYLIHKDLRAPAITCPYWKAESGSIVYNDAREQTVG